MPGEPLPQPQFAINDISPARPATIEVQKVAIPGGEIGFATIQQGNAVLFVPLDKAAATAWADMLANLRDQLSGAGLAVASSQGLIAGRG